jgi:hypothetical protein
LSWKSTIKSATINRVNVGINLSKTSHILFFVVLLPAISFGIGWGFAKTFPDIPFWVETISPLAVYGILYNLFEKYLWHWPLFHSLGVVLVPDVRGRWLGEQISSFRDANGNSRKSRVIMEVEQTFSTITIATYYKNWHTTHTLASFVPVEGECVLFVMFETTPRVEYSGDASAHKGVIRLTQLPDKKLVGTYFNAKGRSGELSFKRTRYALHKTFESIGNSK